MKRPFQRIKELGDRVGRMAGPTRERLSAVALPRVALPSVKVPQVQSEHVPPVVRHGAARVWHWITTTAGLLIFVALVIITGTVSAWYSVQAGLPLNTSRSGSWVVWTHLGDRDSDPYTRARFADLGTLTVSTDRVVRFEARLDSEGRRLHSSCTYELTSPGLDSNWWTIGVFDARGRLIRNQAERHGFNQATIARAPNGAFTIALSRDPQPGNWLPTGTAGRLVLVLEAVEPDDGAVTDGTPTAIVPPTIRQKAC